MQTDQPKIVHKGQCVLWDEIIIFKKYQKLHVAFFLLKLVQEIVI